LTTSGHYCIPIDKTVEVPVESVCAVNFDDLSKNERYKTFVKLHRQFAHPPKKRLSALMKDAGIWREEFEETLDLITNNCELCKMYAKTPSRPVVGMPMASKFNEKVAMDLKQWNGCWILHIIDMWSRYTVSTFINRKKPEKIIDALMREWVGKFGVMGSLMTDNGGEFNSDEVREITSILNIKLCTTSGQSPFQNGLCERVHAITDMMLIKLQADCGKVDLQTLLSWANMARNSLQMWNGFSIISLFLGRTPIFPIL
jgi:transposase InsO family protein